MSSSTHQHSLFISYSLPTFTTLPVHMRFNSMLFCPQGPVGVHVCSTTVGFPQTSLAQLSDLQSILQLLSAVIYRCSISIIQCWLALPACCGPRRMFWENKAQLHNTLNPTFSWVEFEKGKHTLTIWNKSDRKLRLLILITYDSLSVFQCTI